MHEVITRLSKNISLQNVYLFNILLQDALEELRSSDFDLYAKAIELDMASLPFVATGPTSTPGLIRSTMLFAGLFSH